MNEWYDIPSEEMTLEQARSAVRELRKKVAEQFANIQNDWISVKDRLPEKDVGVLVYTRNRFVSTLDHEDIDYLEENGEFHRYNGNQYISHWMPLPQKPESGDVPWVDDDTLPNEDMIPDNEFIGGF